MRTGPDGASIQGVWHAGRQTHANDRANHPLGGSLRKVIPVSPPIRSGSASRCLDVRFSAAPDFLIALILRFRLFLRVGEGRTWLVQPALTIIAVVFRLHSHRLRTIPQAFRAYLRRLSREPLGLNFRIRLSRHRCAARSDMLPSACMTFRRVNQIDALCYSITSATRFSPRKLIRAGRCNRGLACTRPLQRTSGTASCRDRRLLRMTSCPC